MNKRNAVLLLPFLLLPLLTSGCDKAPNPVAPSGSVITLTANPSRITPSGESTITITGFRPDGNRLNPGTQIRLTSSLGSLSANIVEIGADGYASTKLKGDGRVGDASVSAKLTTGDTESTVTVNIAAAKPTILIVAEKTEVDPGEDIFITLFARDENSLPLGAGETIQLATTLGNLTVNGVEVFSVQTGSDGRAVVKFTAGNQAGTAKISAFLANSDVATSDITVRDKEAKLTVLFDRESVALNEKVTVTAIVFNGADRPAQGILVVFSSSGANGTFSVTSQVTGANGQVVSAFTLTDTNTGVTSFTITVQAGGLTSPPKTISITR